MNLFIDTNALLSFYHLTNEDLDELHKLRVLLDKKRVKLFVPDQVVYEFKRNRETKIADALKKLRDRKAPKYPHMAQQYDEYEKLRELQKEFDRQYQELQQKLDDDIEGETLKADKVIQALFEAAEKVTCDSTAVATARERMERGNPPGKDRSLGDAINWGALLAAVPSGEDLHLISGDGDYRSPLEGTKLHPFLREEWEQSKESEIHFYHRISEFFREQYPEIEVAAEAEKDLLIREFTNSGSFAETHRVVAALEGFTSFTEAQLERIIKGAVANSQVYWIAEDLDVHAFLTRIAEAAEGTVDQVFLDQLHSYLEADDAVADNPFAFGGESPFDEDDDDNLPF